MPAIQLSNEEQAALMGLSYLPIVLYVMAIRPRMDFTTGLVGASVGISWQALGEWVYVEPVPGIQSGSPSKSAIRRAAECLQRAGLLSINSTGKRLILKCNLALRDKSAKKQADTRPTHQADTQADTPEAAPLNDSGTQDDTQADTPKKGQADTHPLSGIYTSIPPPPIQLPVEGGAGVEYAEIIKPEIRPAIEAYLLKLPEEIRQPMLDDLMGYMRTQLDKGARVKSPPGVLAKMIKRHKEGEYVPDNAHIGHFLRKQRDISGLAIPEHQPAQKNAPKPPTGEAREMMDKILRKGKKNEQ